MDKVQYSCSICKKLYDAGTGVIVFEQNLKDTYYCPKCTKHKESKK